MRKYLYDYIKEIDNILKNKKVTKEIIDNHLIKINFFQHERLIHLLVTLFYALLFLIFMALGFLHYLFFIITAILLVFLICYIIHYFHLENGVQYLYKQYDMMKKANWLVSFLYCAYKKILIYYLYILLILSDTLLTVSSVGFKYSYILIPYRSCNSSSATSSNIPIKLINCSEYGLT